MRGRFTAYGGLMINVVSNLMRSQVCLIDGLQWCRCVYTSICDRPVCGCVSLRVIHRQQCRARRANPNEGVNDVTSPAGRNLQLAECVVHWIYCNTVHSDFFPNFDYKKSISGPIELKFSGKTLKGALPWGSAGFEAVEKFYPLSSFFIAFDLFNPWTSDLETHTNAFFLPGHHEDIFLQFFLVLEKCLGSV